MGRAGVLLDRDGTVIVDHGYVGTVERVELIDGSAEAIAAFNRANIPVVVITNQAGVARGFYSVDDVERVHGFLADLLAAHGAHVDLFLYCPYHPDGTVPTFARHSFDRKPEPGMALAAARALDLDLQMSWVVGDRSEDMDLALAVGASGVMIGADTDEQQGVWAFPDLGSAAQFILDRMDSTSTDDRPPPLRTPTPGVRAKFPRTSWDDAAAFCHAYFNESNKAAKSVNLATLARASAMLLDTYERGGFVFACGNGGSASIANHLQCDHLKGIRTGTDLRPRVLSMSSNIELITAIANDISYDDVYVYQLQSQALPGDVLVTISASGESANIVRALDWAREHELGTIALTGFGGGKARELAEVSIHVDSANYGVVEDTHQAIMHALSQYIRQSLMSPDAVAIHSF